VVPREKATSGGLLMDTGSNGQVARRGKYVTFSATWFVIVGALSIIAGLAALLNEDYFKNAEAIYGSLQTWGVVWLIEGAINLVVGGLIFKGSGGAKTLGVFIACAGLVVWFFCVGIVPVWAIVHLVAYAMVVYGLVVHGDD